MNTERGRILIVDDDVGIRRTLADRLRAGGNEVLEAVDGIEGLRLVREEDPDLVLLDVQMPRMDGMEVLRHLKEEGLEQTVVVITAHGSVDRAVEGMRAGAFDFVVKPFEAERLGLAVEKALARERLRRGYRALQEEADGSVPTLIGTTRALVDVARTARRAADSGATILILGKSGSGKEVLARNIHHWSPRRREPFVVANCVAMSPQLLESELFGHERGAFTGAERRRRGRFELARGGTIFLDEIGATRPEFQTKLLRVLQDGTYVRVGGEQELTADVRVVAATSRDLEAAVTAGDFIEDLYYRLNVVPIRMPELRQRKGDIPELVEFFIAKYAPDAKREVMGISQAAVDCLMAYDWPGCVRELENAIERAVVLGTASQIETDDLPQHVVAAAARNPDAVGEYQAAVEAFKRQMVADALEKTGGNQTKAAEILGLQRTYLSKLMKNLGLR